jgi:hypothetical protein
VRYFFLHEARVEITQAATRYEAAKIGLGADFVREVDRCVARIAATPEQFPRVHRRCRRCLTNRFPYAIFFEVRPDAVAIVAVGHTARRPGYWKGRLK